MAQVPSADELETLFFSYGTLKPGFPNNKHNPPGARYVGPAQTVEAHPLVVEPGTYIPFLLPPDSRGKRVKGVVYAVTQVAIDTLDEFEDVENAFYERRLVSVVLDSGDTQSVFAYFRHPDGGGPAWARPWTIEKLSTLEMIDEYTLEHAEKFVRREDRQ